MARTSAAPARANSPAPPDPLDPAVSAVREFNRFCTRRIGVLREGLLETRFSLTEARVLYELAYRNQATATELAHDLNLDAGYLSRILRRFRARRLVQRSRSKHDRRQNRLVLTNRGRAEFAPLDRRAAEDAAALLQRLSSAQQRQLVAAMGTIEGLLRETAAPRGGWLLRAHRPGDMGWVVQRHGTLYWNEYRYDERFEALVAEITAKFIQNLDPQRERCWIAEQGAENVGCIFLVRDTDEIAKLRLFLVEPHVRGQGIGRRLMDECVRFAREASYKKIKLWTQSELLAARHLYEAAGFRQITQEMHDSFGRSGLVAEVWELPLVSCD